MTELIQTKTGEEGFTLIEVLISLFIFALISVGTMTALTQSLRGKSRLNDAVTDINKINSARSILSADLSTITLRPMRDELGGFMPYSLTTDGEALLTFTRRGHENPGGLESRGDLERVEYHFINTEFIRRSFSHENPSSDPTYFDRVLLDDLQNVSLRGHIARSTTNVAGASSIETDQIRVLANQPSITAPAQRGVPNFDPQPNAISFEMTDNFGDTITHFFELRL